MKLIQVQDNVIPAGTSRKGYKAAGSLFFLLLILLRRLCLHFRPLRFNTIPSCSL